ncbi:aminotransferase class V-fold PLP-dependent enzyme [Parapedobacter lycopersici]|uniref:aminotransferase class V-fold PLP-dependent enzyme n=1 Tax=Parapedobacter lycopersici TaxID=1864939 RepID=UPI00214D6895|nr:aminotransferase class V-fold PLP-dependent enzyme [Parapedobacter lycopersici]
MKRRDVIKGLSLLPLIGSYNGGPVNLQDEKTAKADVSASQSADLFDELGVTRYINAGGTITVISGSLMMPEVMEAINSTSHDFANMHELQDKAGAKIAEMLGCGGAMVTSGAAGGILLGTAACITGSDPELISALPDVPGPKREVIIQKGHRNRFDQIVRTCGARLVEVEGAAEMEAAINEHTVMAFYKNNAPSPEYHTTITHEEFVAVAKKHGIPTFIDAAADVPPVDNLFKFQKIGFDLITFSGGKMIRGPQSAGLLFGRKDLIEAAKLNHSPYESPIGRPMKVNKEEIFGMYAALKSYLARDHEKEWQSWLDRIETIREQLETIPTVKGATSVAPGPANAYPRLQLQWDQNRVGITPEEVSEKLKTGTPAILAGGRGDTLNVGVVLLRPDQVAIVAQRVKEILTEALRA